MGCPVLPLGQEAASVAKGYSDSYSPLSSDTDLSNSESDYETDSDSNHEDSVLIPTQRKDKRSGVEEEEEVQEEKEEEESSDRETLEVANELLKKIRREAEDDNWAPRSPEVSTTHLVDATQGDITERTVDQHPEAQEIHKAEDREVATLTDFDVYGWCRLPDGRKSIGSRYVYSKGTDPRKPAWKARFVGKGFSQLAMVDYFQTTSPTPRIETIFFVLTLVASLDLPDFQGDAKGAFLQAPIDAEIYIDPPYNVKPPFLGAVWLLKKALYGLKQAGRQWYEHFSKILLAIGFIRCEMDKCLFIFFDHAKFILFIFHVDDFVGGADSPATVQWLRAILEDKIRLSHFGEITTFLGMEFTRDREKRTFEVRQEGHINALVEKFRLQEANPRQVPVDPKMAKDAVGGIEFEFINLFQQLAGAILFISNARKEIDFAANFLCRFMQKPTKVIWEIGKDTVKFLKCTIKKPLVLGGKITDFNNLFCAFSDGDWAADKANRRSTSGTCVFMNGSCILSEARLQPTVALHVVESEYYALGEATKSVLFFLHLLEELKLFPKQDPVPIYVDSSGAKALAQGGGAFRARKHIEVRHHFVAHHVAEKNIIICKIPSEQNVADTNTKPLGRNLFTKHSNSIMAGI